MPVGKKLAAERRARGKQLAEVEYATKIMGRMLDALENERWADLPAPVYVKGYIQNYAGVLGIDPKPLLEEYAKDIGDVSPEATSHRALEPSLDRIPEQALVPQHFELHDIPRQLWIAIAVAVLLIALLIWGIAAIISPDEDPPPIPPVTTPSVTPTTTAPAVTDTLPATGETAEVAFTLGVTVAQGQSSWLRITVDGVVEYEGTLSSSTKEYGVTEDANVRIGKPQAVTVTRDGVDVDVPSSDGIAEVTLTAE